VDQRRIHPETLAGDPFAAAGLAQDHPDACMEGWIYLSYTAVDEETGEDVEVIEAVECRRCVNTDRRYRQEAMISCVDRREQ
jgi:hypothetical protein